MKTALKALGLAGLIIATSAFAHKKDKIVEIKKITHFLAYDLDKSDFIVYDSTDDVRVFVVGPEGITPAVVISESEDKKSVLLASKAIATKVLHKGAPDDPLATPPEPTEPLHSAGR